MYNGKELFNNFSAKSNKLPVGIHQNVSLIEARIDDGYTEFNFKSDAGTMNKRLWAPSGKFPFKDETPDMAQKRQEMENLEFTLGLLVALSGEEALENVNGVDYNAIMLKAVALIDKNKGRYTLNLKIVYDYKGAYTELPTFGSIERYEEGVAPKLKFTDKELETRMKRKENLNSANKTSDNDYLADLNPTTSVSDLDNIEY